MKTNRDDSFKKRFINLVNNQAVREYVKGHWKAIASGAIAVGAGIYFTQTRPQRIKSK